MFLKDKNGSTGLAVQVNSTYKINVVLKIQEMKCKKHVKLYALLTKTKTKQKTSYLKKNYKSKNSPKLRMKIKLQRNITHGKQDGLGKLLAIFMTNIESNFDLATIPVPEDNTNALEC